METKRVYDETTDWERKGWLCCDKRGDLRLFENLPQKMVNGDWSDGNHNEVYIPKGAAPDMTNKDRPVFVKIEKQYVSHVKVTIFEP